jgi:hypothetical protein
MGRRLFNQENIASTFELLFNLTQEAPALPGHNVLLLRALRYSFPQEGAQLARCLKRCRATVWTS